MPKKILFIMCDQLRFDYLGCTGHPSIKTPNIDALAARGVRFDQTYVQSPICGPSRMSFYTGRYVRSHGSTWNSYPLRVGEMTLGDHLRPLGVRTVLCGKTHMRADLAGMERLGIDMSSEIGALVAECGFEVWDRSDGVVPEGVANNPSKYKAQFTNCMRSLYVPFEIKGKDHHGSQAVSGMAVQDRPTRPGAAASGRSRAFGGTGGICFPGCDRRQCG